MHLCKHLKPILDFELNNGNQIDEISTGWSNAEYVVDLTNKITYNDLNKLDNFIEQWENRDNHYKLQKGFYCNKCNHSIAGPL